MDEIGNVLLLVIMLCASVYALVTGLAVLLGRDAWLHPAGFRIAFVMQLQRWSRLAALINRTIMGLGFLVGGCHMMWTAIGFFRGE